jgi:hypothetical protein
MRTDARGQAETTELGPGSWRLVVRHPNHPALAVPLEIPVGLGRVRKEVRLELGARLVGTVRSQEGLPIGGARMHIESPYGETFLRIEATTDDTGRYATERVLSLGETLEILATAAGFAEGSVLIGVQPAHIRAGEATQDFVLTRPGVSIRGRVLEESGSGVAGASVRSARIDRTGLGPVDPLAFFKGAPSEPWLWREVAKTDNTGRFEVTGLSGLLEHAFLFLHESHAPRTVWLPPGEEGVTIDLGEVTLLAHGGLFGQARWQDGTPAEGERLSLYQVNRVYLHEGESLSEWRPDAWFHDLTVTVAEGGWFRFDQLAPGAYQFIALDHAEEQVVSGHHTGPIELVLDGGPTGPMNDITGVVRDRAGEVLPMVFVRAYEQQGADERLCASDLTRGTGEFSLRVSSGSTLRLAFRDMRGAHEDGELHVPNAGRQEPLEVVLEPRPAPLGPVEGLVIAPDGVPVEGATVTLHPPEDALCACIAFHRETDAAGAFRFSVGDGPHRLVASDPRYASATYAPAWPGDHVLLDLVER